MASKVKTTLSLFALVAVIALGVAVFGYVSYNTAAVKGYGDPTGTTDFTISEGESVDEIAQDLLDKKLISNSFFFHIYIRQHNIADKLQAGSFKIPNNLSLKDLTDILQHAVFPDVWVTIPEGLMATEIADILEEGFSEYEEASLDKAEFLAIVTNPSSSGETYDNPAPEGATLEGYLFPDTYRFPPDATAEYVVITMLGTFYEKCTAPHLEEIEASDYSLHEIVTLASIVEREAGQPEDWPIVADILERRLDNGWALEVDVSLLYYFGDWKRELTHEDLQVDTPYNTRKYGGLPPTPISNPGVSAFEAVLYPEANDYWFFLADSDGVLHYGRTLEEHNANISEFL